MKDRSPIPQPMPPAFKLAQQGLQDLAKLAGGHVIAVDADEAPPSLTDLLAQGGEAVVRLQTPPKP